MPLCLDICKKPEDSCIWYNHCISSVREELFTDCRPKASNQMLAACLFHPTLPAYWGHSGSWYINKITLLLISVTQCLWGLIFFQTSLALFLCFCWISQPASVLSLIPVPLRHLVKVLIWNTAHLSWFLKIPFHARPLYYQTSNKTLPKTAVSLHKVVLANKLPFLLEGGGGVAMWQISIRIQEWGDLKLESGASLFYEEAGWLQRASCQFFSLAGSLSFPPSIFLYQVSFLLPSLSCLCISRLFILQSSFAFFIFLLTAPYHLRGLFSDQKTFHSLGNSATSILFLLL